VGSDETRQLVWWRRWHENSQVVCLMNFNQSDITFEPTLATLCGRKILDSAEPKWSGSGSSAPEELQPGRQSTLPAQSVVLYESKQI
jgi:maltooligosyltrehalose trehalohydrolase